MPNIPTFFLPNGAGFPSSTVICVQVSHFSALLLGCYNQLSQGGIAISHEDSAALCISFTWLIAYVVVVNCAGIVSSQGVFTTFGNYISRLRETICSMGSKKTHWGTAATIHLKSPIGLLAQANVCGIMPNL